MTSWKVGSYQLEICDNSFASDYDINDALCGAQDSGRFTQQCFFVFSMAEVCKRIEKHEAGGFESFDTIPIKLPRKVLLFDSTPLFEEVYISGFTITIWPMFMGV